MQNQENAIPAGPPRPPPWANTASTNNPVLVMDKPPVRTTFTARRPLGQMPSMENMQTPRNDHIALPQYPPVKPSPYQGDLPFTPALRSNDAFTTPNQTPFLVECYSSRCAATPIVSVHHTEAAELEGIQPPALYPGPLPLGYVRKEPVPPDDGRDDEDSSDKRQRHGAPSINPWDYMSNAEVDALSTPRFGLVMGDQFKGKARRRFSRRELETLEVMWCTGKSPTKFERQRLGSWLGVKTKHITVWFQNRRQEEKRYANRPISPVPRARLKQGTFDPTIGKWRPVPSSCISFLVPPSEAKLAVVTAIALGSISPEAYYNQHPAASGSMEATTPSGPGESLDEVLKAREDAFGPTRHTIRPPVIANEDDDEQRRKRLIELMPSDAPSSDAIGPDEEEEEEEDEDLDGSPEPKQRPKTRPRQLAFSRPSVLAKHKLGRATSHDILFASKRAKELSEQTPPCILKRLPSVSDERRVRPRHTDLISLKPQNSFTRSASDEDPSLSQRTPGFVRSASFSSATTLPDAVTPGSVRKHQTENRGEVVNGKKPADEEVISAASSLLAMLGGSQ